MTTQRGARAPHVQAAISVGRAAPAQSKAAVPDRRLAPHVRTAIGVAAQPRSAQPEPAGLRLAPHVRTALASTRAGGETRPAHPRSSSGAQPSPVLRHAGLSPRLASPRTVQRALSDSDSGSEDGTNYLNIEIKEPKFKTWTRDVEEIDFESDLELFQQKVTSANPKIVHVGTYQGTGQHVEVFAKTATGQWVKMDMASTGSRIIYPARGPSGHQVDEVKGELKKMKLHDLFKKFFEVAKVRKFDFLDYNCERFASALMSELVDYEESDFFF